MGGLLKQDSFCPVSASRSEGPCGLWSMSEEISARRRWAALEGRPPKPGNAGAGQTGQRATGADCEWVAERPGEHTQAQRDRRALHQRLPRNRGRSVRHGVRTGRNPRHHWLNRSPERALLRSGHRPSGEKYTPVVRLDKPGGVILAIGPSGGASPRRTIISERLRAPNRLPSRRGSGSLPLRAVHCWCVVQVRCGFRAQPGPTPHNRAAHSAKRYFAHRAQMLVALTRAVSA